ncbi:MAG TPA: hypothetical protein VJS89_07370 [Gammaproteobacteria bacterium]|nr:hypothetical protein [Gammaproteobacteria bacterium]
MRVKLDKKWIDYLVSKPESGMGYQRVDVRLQDGRLIKNLTVFNAEDLELPDEFARQKIEELHLHP